MTHRVAFGSAVFGRVIRAGSRFIVIWKSTDLTRWSKPRLVIQDGPTSDYRTHAEDY